MATKINDTTVFQITTPGENDLLLGTDVSDTSNDPDGQTVNFKAEDVPLLTKNSGIWHPYNMVYFGDGNDGLIYDNSVDGNVLSVETPVFEAGYEYAVYFDDILCAQTGFQIQAQARITSTVTYGPYIDVTSTIPGKFVDAFYIPLPSLARRIFRCDWLFYSLYSERHTLISLGSADTIDRLGKGI
jgi:hypothetical protein